MSASQRERFARFPTDEWEARSSRGWFAFFVAYVVGTLLFAYASLFGPPGLFKGLTPQVEASAVRMYISMSGQFDWLLPMVFAALVALGVWTRLNTALSRQERLELGVRQAGVALIAAGSCLLAIVAIAARIRGVVAPSGTVAPVLGLAVIVIARMEVGRVTPRIPLAAQRMNAKREIRRLEKQVAIWAPTDPLRGRRVQAVLVAAVGPAIGVLICVAFPGAYPPTEAIAAAIIAFFLALGLGWVSCLTSWLRVASLKLVSLRSRVAGAVVSAVLVLGAATAIGGIAFVFINGGEPQLGIAVVLSVLWLLTSALWTGRRRSPSVVAERTIGGWIRVAAVRSMERQLDRQRKRKKKITAEIRKRSGDSSSMPFERRDLRPAGGSSL